MEIKIRIPGKPMGKQRARTLKNGYSYTPEQTVSYENLVKMIYREKNGPYFVGAIEADIKIWYDIPNSKSKKEKRLMAAGEILPTKKPDIDNIQKILFDALNGIAYKDDTQIVKVTAEKRYISNENETPCTILCLREMEAGIG